MAEIDIFLEEHDARFAETETESVRIKWELEWLEYVNREN